VPEIPPALEPSPGQLQAGTNPNPNHIFKHDNPNPTHTDPT